MSLTKSQLEQLNNSSFPNNNAGYITPEILRTYNSSSIAATVNQDAYTLDSASFDNRIDNIVAGTEYTTTASFNAFTQSTNAFTASTNNFTASYFVASASFSSRIEAIDDDNVTTASFNQYTASNDTKVNNLNTISASYLAFTQSYYSDSASFDGRLDGTATTGSNTFNGNQIINGNVSASSFVSASRFIGDGSQLTGLTSSISIGILDDGVLKGNATSLNFTGSGIVASVVAGIAIIEATVDQSTLNQYTLTSSFNSFTQSYQTDSASFNSRINSVNVNTASFVTTSSFNAYTQSTNQFTASISTSVGLLQTFSGSQYKGDSSSFDSRINSVSTSVGLLQTFSASSDSRYVQNSQTSSMAVSSSTYAVTSSYAVNSQTASEARNLIVIARNGNQSTLSAGTVVHITGASGDNPIFNTASFDTELLSANTLGILRSTLTSGADGEVVVNGIVTGVNTDPTLGYAAGDVVYLSASGQFTKVQPQAPNQIVVLGQVLRAQQNNGSLYVSINNGWELNELHNVQINTPLTNDILAYESSSYGLWKNKSFSSLGLNTTASFNSYTSSTNSRLNSLESYTASVSTSVGLLQTFSSSQYKADSSSFDSRINAITGSGGTINTSSFATTGSNIFVGDQYVSNGVLQVATYPQTGKTWFSPTAIEAVGTASVAYEQFVDGGGYDAFNVITTLDSGSQFRDLPSDTFVLNTWLEIPRNTGNNPAPQFKRGLGITGSVSVTGSTTLVGNQTITGSLILSSSAATELQVIGAVEITGSVAGNITALTVASSTASIDFSRGTFFTLTIPSSSVTYITGSNLKPGMTANIVLTQQSTTGSVRWESSLFKFPSGSINTGSAVASAVDLVSVMSVNTTNLLSVGANRLI